ncbi:MAG: PQQ-dependent sugar dehydrogenase [Phycisphaeraceae bacterium]|nr:PQQ-dependent sugar dehydrogenase [Phycisphaeraceae bacterium]
MRTHGVMRWAALGAVVIVTGAARGQGIDELWSRNCLSCHGKEGQGGGAGTRTLLTDELMDQGLDRRFFDAIKNGVPDSAMPGFGETLKDEQIWALVVEVRELQAAAWRKRVGSPKADRQGVYTTSLHRYRVRPVVERGLETPWSVDWLPSGEMLVTERAGRLRVWKDGKLSAPVEGLPAVSARGQGGLMDVAVHPKFAENGWVYLASTEASPDGKREMTKILRGTLDVRKTPAVWTQDRVIFEAKPEHYSGPGVHYGCRIVFDPKDPGLMYFGIGERGQMDLAQNLERPNGKVYRVRDDGSVPKDNPFVGRGGGTYEQVWSFGHRNPQGLAFDLNGSLWDTEHGPRGGDELNLIEKGANYGWPLVSYGINYSGAPFRAPWSEVMGARGTPKTGGAVRMPVYRWLPSIGACGLDVARGPAFTKWKGDLFAGGLSGANVDRLRIADGKLVEREEIFHGQGRVRDVVCGPDGTIYIVLNGPDKVVRLVPAD